MALIRHSAALRCVRRLPQHPSSTLPTAARPFSVSMRRPGGAKDDHHAPEFDPPSGWLWGVPPGEKPKKEGWERTMYVYMASFVALTVGLAFKPDTSLDTWALEEARRRLEKEGILEDPFPGNKSS